MVIDMLQIVGFAWQDDGFNDPDSCQFYAKMLDGESVSLGGVIPLPKEDGSLYYSAWVDRNEADARYDARLFDSPNDAKDWVEANAY